MRSLLKLFLLIILAVIALPILLVLVIVAIVALPLLWEHITARYTSPPDQGATAG